MNGNLGNPRIAITAGAEAFGRAPMQRQPLSCRHFQAGSLPEEVMGKPPHRLAGHDRGHRCLIQRREDSLDICAAVT
jgi:hypothetical protein